MARKKRAAVAVSGDGTSKTYTVRDAIAKEPQMIEVPFRELNDCEKIVTGFRAGFFDVTEDDGTRIGGASGGAGFGSEWVHLEWRGRTMSLRTTELLRAWVARIAPEDLHLFPEGMR